MGNGKRKQDCCLDSRVKICSVLVLGLLFVTGAGLTAFSGVSMFRYFQSDLQILFPHELFQDLLLCLGAGLGTTLSGILLAVGLTNPRCAWLGLVSVLLLTTLTVVAGTFILVYSISGDDKLDMVTVQKYYGEKGRNDVTLAWDSVEGNFQCSSALIDLQIATLPVHAYPLRLGPARTFFLKDTVMPCEEAFVSYHSFSMITAYEVCEPRSQCTAKVPLEIHFRSRVLACTAFVCAVLQIIAEIVLICLHPTLLRKPKLTTKFMSEDKAPVIYEHDYYWQGMDVDLKEDDNNFD